LFFLNHPIPLKIARYAYKQIQPPNTQSANKKYLLLTPSAFFKGDADAAAAAASLMSSLSTSPASMAALSKAGATAFWGLPSTSNSSSV